MANLNIAIKIAAQDAASGPIGRIQKALGGLSGVGQKAAGALGNVVMLAGGAALGGIAALGGGIAAAGAAGLSMNQQMENVTAQLNAFTKDGEKSAEILEMIRQRAAATPFAFNEMASATAGLLPAAKQSGAELENLLGMAEILAASNPAQGLEGAAFALREAVSGDFTSIIERFNLPRQYINQLKDEGVPALEAVQMAMQQVGFDADLVSNLAQTAGGRWSTFLDTLQNLASTVTQPIFDTFSEGMGLVNEWLTANEPLITGLAETLAGTVAGAIETVTGVVQSFMANLEEGMSPLNAFIEAIWDIAPQWLLDALVYLRDEIIPGVQSAFETILPVVVQFAQDVWSQLMPGLQLLGDLGLQLANAVLPLLSSAWDYLMENLDTILPIVGAVGIVILALSSPITTVVALIVALATAWANNWGGIQEKTTAVMEALQPWWDRLSELFANFIDALLPRLQEVWQTLVNVWQTELQPALSDLWAAFGDLFEALGLGAGDVDWLSVVTGSLKLALGGVLLMVELLNPIIQWYSTVIGFAVDQVTLMVDAVASLKNALDYIIGPLGRVADKIGDMVSAALTMPDWMIPGSPTPFELGLRGIGRAINSLPDLELPTSGGGIGSMAAQGALPQASPVMGGATWNITIQANDEAGGRKAATGFIEELRARGLR